MDERHTAGGRPSGHRPGGLRVDAKGELAFVLGTIDRSVRRWVDDEIRRHLVERSGHVFRLREIEPTAIRGDERPRTLERRTERRADLAGDAGQQDPHQMCP